MNTDLDALATRLYVTVDDLLIDHLPGDRSDPRCATLGR